MTHQNKPAIWFPTVRTNTGTDIFTKRLVEGLNKKGIRAEITWLPLRAEYLPWTVAIPQPPEWATIVHVNTWLHNRFLPKNLPLIATIHHSIHDPKLRPYKGILRTLYHQYWITPNERRVMKKAQQVTAVSQFVANIAKETLCDVPIDVIYNGIDTSVFYPTDRIRDNDKPFRLLYVGGWKKLKGVDLLAPIMHDLGDEYELYYTSGLEADKDKKNMPSNMYNLGRLTQLEVVKEMQMADAFLFPSRSEGFGLVATEAMACGLPVIATHGSSLIELIREGENGILCKQDEVADFSQAARKLAHDDVFYSYCSNENRRRAIQEFSFETMCAGYIHVYQAQHNK